MSKSELRYYAKNEKQAPVPQAVETAHSEFLRTGRISRRREDWVSEERRYLSYAEVAEKTGKRLQAVGEKSHERINSFHRSIRFPRIVFHRTFADTPHLGYCHVTASRTNFASFADVKWSFYIANFFSDIGEDGAFFDRIQPHYSRMYFAVAMQPERPTRTFSIDRSIRPNGLLFKTHDPMVALKNVLKLGAATPQLRDAIDRL
ncbi:DUF6656 family protein [Agrobacterium sp. ES01]|uniref:DUF6656 family protein n=1 Tax=Agrobacterium sp. ES01 TaxID=3420714 RepID=UPI003D0EA358